eukprot:COSAG06_NODE_8383_length_2190_cov_1.127212_1_plen_690_part_01
MDLGLRMALSLQSALNATLLLVVLLLSVQLHTTTRRLQALEDAQGRDRIRSSAIGTDVGSLGTVPTTGRRSLAEEAEGNQQPAECYGADEVAMAALNASVALSQSHARLEAALANKANASAVLEQLSEKPDATAVSAQLEGEVDRSVLEAGLLGKADVAAVDALSADIESKASTEAVLEWLKSKANASVVEALSQAVLLKASADELSAVSAAVSEKADASAVAEQLAGKAELSVVLGLLSSKANASAMTALEQEKADATVVGALSTEVAGKAEQSELSSLASAIEDKAAASELAAVLVDMQALRDEVVELRATLATLSLGSCGDVNGPGGSVQPVTDADCGTGYIANPLASEARCAGPACDIENVAEDKAACCAAQASCGDADGVGNATSTVSDADCGIGYVYDPEAVDSLCVGTICDPGSVEADKAACCTALATCGDRDGEGPGVASVSDGDCGAGLIYNVSAAAMFCEAPVCNVSNGTADHLVCCGPYSDVPSCLSDVGDGPGSCLIYLRADARGMGTVTVAAGQSFEVHGGGQPLLEVEADWEVASGASLVLTDHRLLGGSGGAASMQSGGDVTLLRMEISSGTVTFSSSLTMTACILTSAELIGNTTSSLLSLSGGMLMGSTLSLGGGSATMGGSSVLVNSPVSITAATLSASQCELQSDGSSIPLMVESSGSATVTNVIFRSSAS